MTLLDFETHFRPAKIVKAREMYLKGHVAELKKAKIVWVAKMKIGRYTVHINLTGISINGSSCNCDDRPRSGFCNHSVAVLFAVRKEMDLFPALNNIRYKVARTDDRLTSLLEPLQDPDFPPTSKYAKLFTGTANKMLQDMDKAILQKEYVLAAGIGFAIITGIQDMAKYLEDNYEEGDACIDKTFTSLEKWWQCPIEEEIRDAFAHDARLEAIRNFRSDRDIHKKWMDLLWLSADSITRKEKLTTTINKFNQIDEIYPAENSFF